MHDDERIDEGVYEDAMDDELAWPDSFDVNCSLKHFTSLTPGQSEIRIAGRITAIREFGKLTFGRISDIHTSVQFALQFSNLGEAYRKIVTTMHRGDYVGLKGDTMVTRTGELTLDVREWICLSRCRRVLPEKFHGIADPEIRMRKRYLDLMANRSAADRFLSRTSVLRSVRRYLEDRDFIEVETPILCNTPSGAIARPFATDYAALDMKAFLRIAPETYLKRAVAGGFPRVFEFARCFRNEGIDPTHLPDFTMLEFYASYWNVDDMHRFVREMLISVVEDLEAGAGAGIDYSHAGDWVGGDSWRVVSMADLIAEITGIDISNADGDSLREELIRRRYPEIDSSVCEHGSYGTLVDLVFKKICRPRIELPTFITGHPASISPLARRNSRNPAIADRFQLVIRGWEVVNAYSELVHPGEQRRRFDQQAAIRASGDDEAMLLDNDFLMSMEYGMPPMAGCGIGIDRLVAILTGAENLRDVVLFPLLKPDDMLP